MKEKEQYIEDLKEIKEMMNRSSKFISLSGLSGISAGIIALIGAWFAHTLIYEELVLNYTSNAIGKEIIYKLTGLAVATLLAAIIAGIFFTTQKAKKANQPIWDAQSKLVVANLAIPLVSGGFLILLLLQKGIIGLLAPLTLIFYGLALVNASKYTFKEIRSLGIIEIILGLISINFIGYGLYFWAFGFGVLHIVYGIIMQSKYGS
ncbi:MAG: hypothetical protein L3J06_01410 [Cyclobacteriaceae bacterium]|nr:hypothetical protein [Cyclobacteriaceae bacterium]